MAAQNLSLARLIDEARWTNGEVARAVNRVGTELGLSLRYDDSAVCHWLTGTVPRKRVHDAIVEAFSRRLSRPITPKEAGLGGTLESSANAPDTVAELIELGGVDMDPSRRAILGAAGLYSAAALIPGFPDATERFASYRRNPRMKIGHAEVDAVVAMTVRISEIDDMFGGRHARPMAAAFLVNTIAPYLKADGPEDVRKAMLSAAADHCYLTGYMAMDERADGLAQRYYTKALELAGGAEDHLTYCTTLRGMSVQAVDLGHSARSLQLADAAATASPQAGPRMRAFLAGQQAHAAAQTGDKPTALRRMREAEAAMDQAESRAKTFGSYSPSALHYHMAQVRYSLGDVAGSVEAMQESDRLREPVYRRTRVRYGAMLAERKLQVGRLEEACADWERMLDDYQHVQSGRCDDRYRSMMSAIRPHMRNQHVRNLYERARPLAPA
ncbi:tetratricopeptide repeat protein [Streptomyces katsurahamanus]|uniref:Tetratricopeptide repeat protein n=1 Tax=Streptomyces katsurahamanus TaxID=2577098 RepID=A0ABW9NSF5_9ACTN|nr:tetratricopeptide repeat protein [Streptomyces katsurahamanus]MQS35799.1 tetratricopeptide repeat protein [Streptomyces katsurahamanus]